MTPGARIAAAIELLKAAEAASRPADRVANGFFRARRYIGAKDRRAVGALVYRVLRARARLDWWLTRAASKPVTARARVVAAMVLIDGKTLSDIAGLFDGAGYDPAPLDPAEHDLIKALAGEGLDHGEQPDWVRLEVPEWLVAELRESLGEDLETELAALAGEAPLDLRVNRLKADRAQAIAALAEDRIVAAPTPWSPVGLRVDGRRNLPTARAFRDGLVEVQDEGSQLVALLTDARPGMTVADLCAGAGGKTLALAATMAGQGRLAAFDLDATRLSRAGPRIARAGAGNVVLHGLTAGDDGAPGDPVLADLAGSCERVLVDASCSGSGAWRRNPDARWRLSPEMLEAYQQQQIRALDTAARLVAPGGRLIYATCSLIPAENQRMAEGFLARHDTFAPLPVARVWAETLTAPCPDGAGNLLLTPARHGTDGFFVAIFECQSAP